MQGSEARVPLRERRAAEERPAGNKHDDDAGAKQKHRQIGTDEYSHRDAPGR